MALAYLYERQTEYWTGRGMEDYFLDAGMEVVTLPIWRLGEKTMPFEFVLNPEQECRIFGVQYKSLHHHGQTEFWKLFRHQHLILQNFEEWAFYGFSEMTSWSEHRIAIHKTLFVPVSLEFREQVYPKETLGIQKRWNDFVRALEAGSIGHAVADRREILEALKGYERSFIEEDVDQGLIDLFLINFQQRRLLHIDGKIQ